jgi:uncharacterized protein DUF3854
MARSSQEKTSNKKGSRQATQRRSGKLLEFKTPGASALDDLKRSGLSALDARRMQIEPLDANVVRKLTKDKIFDRCYKIPYFNIDASIDPLFYRLRRLIVEEGSNDKYWQPRDTIPRLYMPPLLTDKQTWAQVAANTATEIYITEGEKKAAKACLLGKVCAGLGGVNNFKSKKAGMPLIRDLEAIDWKTRQVIFVCDAEVIGRTSLLGALNALADELAKLGALCTRIDLPPSLDGKIGLDDYLLKNEIADFDALERTQLGGVLRELNDEYAVLRSPAGEILRLSDGEAISLYNFTQAEVSNRRIVAYSAKGMEDKNGGREWLNWQQRTELEKIVYEPGKGFPIFATADGLRYYNRWRGLAVAPATECSDTDVAEFFWLFDHVFDKLSAQHRAWLLSWFAYPFQRPGVHME